MHTVKIAPLQWLLVLVILSVTLVVRAARNQEWSNWAYAGLGIVQLLLVAECLLGVVLWAQGQRPARPQAHVMYGLVAVVCVPLVFGWLRTRTPRQAQFGMGAVCVFLGAIVLRALQTARIS